MSETISVRVPIRLGQFLKVAGVVDSGADAHDLIADGDVEVDGALETQRGRQLRGGEEVTIVTDTHEIHLVVEASL